MKQIKPVILLYNI